MQKATDHPCIASRQFFNECFIEGHVDYIFGDAKAVFDHCELHSREHHTVMITAQSKLFPQEDSGYYLLHSKITGDYPGAQVFFGRPWRDYANVLFYDTDIQQQLAPAGWEEWGGRLKTATYREYRSHGPGVNAGNRSVPYPPLTGTEEKSLNPTAILADWTEWDPLQEVARLREQIAETTFKKDPIGWPLKASNKGEPQRPFNPKLPTIWIVGDSTAAFHADKPEEGELRSQGWGLYFPKYFDLSKVNVVNAARGGRSSRTYRTEGLWDTVRSHIKRGDIVLIQLGQNDVFAINDETRARGTIPGTGDESQEIDNLLTKKHETVHTYGWYLRQYIRDTKALGAMPIVLSLTPRDQWLPDAHMERGTPDYRTWSMEVAKQEGHAPFVDISTIVATQCEKLGREETAKLYHDGEPVHFNTIGARKFTEWTVAGIIASHAGHLSAYLGAMGKNLPPLSQAP